MTNKINGKEAAAMTLKQLRKRAGLTQKEAAARIGITARNLRRWENQGGMKITLASLYRLAVVYGIDFQSWFDAM